MTITVVLAVLAAYGITYAVPNASPGARRRPRPGVIDELGDAVLGEPPA